MQTCVNCIYIFAISLRLETPSKRSVMISVARVHTYVATHISSTFPSTFKYGDEHAALCALRVQCL